ncbi:MAG: hypothetical protein CMI24_06975 [Opitutae bacterium]|nr:hypothetical protein [Opitutae bacterium]
MKKVFLLSLTVLLNDSWLVKAQEGDLISIQDMIQTMDDLLGNTNDTPLGVGSTGTSDPFLQGNSPSSTFQFPSIENSRPQTILPRVNSRSLFEDKAPPASPPTKSYRMNEELMLPLLRNPIKPVLDPVVEETDASSSPEDFSKMEDPSESVEGNVIDNSAFLPKMDYQNADLDVLLTEVDTLELPEYESPIVLPSKGVRPQIGNSAITTTDPNREVTFQKSSDEPSAGVQPVVDDFIVLGERIDQELREKIREAVMSTRMASGGSNNPFVTRTVFKAVSNCNRVLGRLNAPFHKRYRRDVLLSMIRMHERNRAWVDAIKTYERYIEEFAADDSYPFEDHEDAPGIPDLQASVGSLRKWTEGKERGAPTIPETHVRMGKIYRKLGAHRMALNKFYDAINATLTLPKNNSFELADRRSGRAIDSRSDAESNQAMFEIAETFMDSEDYDQAVKFYDRLWRLEQLRDFDRAIVRFKQGLAHYRRAIDNLRLDERNKKSSGESGEENELPFDKTPKADFAKVKEVLRGYGTIYPQSPYVPESHYILALTYEQLHQDEESIKELIVLLKEAEFNPEKLQNLEVDRAERDKNLEFISKMKNVWNFWKKKTGNYLANKFFEDAEYFNAYRVYSAMRKVDSSPTWQVPVLYQIALCQEKLGNFVQATETYMSIEEFVNTVKEAREDLANSEYLNFVFGMAKWRREQLEETRSIRQAVKRYGIFQTASPSSPIGN